MYDMRVHFKNECDAVNAAASPLIDTASVAGIAAHVISLSGRFGNIISVTNDGLRVICWMDRYLSAWGFDGVSVKPPRGEGFIIPFPVNSRLARSLRSRQYVLHKLSFLMENTFASGNDHSRCMWHKTRRTENHLPGYSSSATNFVKDTMRFSRTAGETICVLKRW